MPNVRSLGNVDCVSGCVQCEIIGRHVDCVSGCA